MADWHLSFNGPPMALAEVERLVSAVAGGSVASELGESMGNPYDSYFQSVTITGPHVVMHATGGLRSPTDADPRISSLRVQLQAPAAAAKHATWRAFAEAFAKLGWTDDTLASSAAEIVDDADPETAARLREEITAALVAFAPGCAAVILRSPRCDDLEAVLAAHRTDIVTVALIDCGLRALPAGLARFPNIESLTLEEAALDGSALRGVSLPRLTQLTMRGAGLRRLCAADAAGFPMLERLDLRGSALAELDPGIIEACPKLSFVYVEDTPLCRDERTLAELRARWPNVKW